MVATGPLVAEVRPLAHLVAGRVREPALEVLANLEPLRIREHDPPVLVGKCRDLLLVRLLGGRPIEAHPLAAGRGVQDSAGLIAAVLAAAGLRALSVGVLLSPGHAL